MHTLPASLDRPSVSTSTHIKAPATKKAATHIIPRLSVLSTLNIGNTALAKQTSGQSTAAYPILLRAVADHEAAGHRSPMTRYPTVQMYRCVYASCGVLSVLARIHNQTIQRTTIAIKLPPTKHVCHTRFPGRDLASVTSRRKTGRPSLANVYQK